MLKFFIERPIFASVISVAIVFAGLLSLRYLPIELYPNIVPPQITISTTYNGASAETIAESVAAPLEAAVNGVPNMIYMYSQNASSGQMNLNIFFAIGTSPQKALMDVQNKVNLILPSLPDAVQGSIQVAESTPSFLLILAIQSPSGRYDPIYTSNYASLNIADDLKRIKGVGSVNVFGASDYSMRIWLNPDQMAQLEITTTDIVNAIRVQNNLYPIGEVGAPPSIGRVDLTFPIITKGRLTEPSQYESIILKATPQGAFVRIRDVARVELGSQSYNMIGELNGNATTLIAVYQQVGANSILVSNAIKKEMKRLSASFPEGITYSIPYDTTKFDRASIRDVIRTVFEAALLVILVMFIFLHNLRATLIPVIALFVSIIGTFAGMYFLGFSLNTLTLFGLVLAVGIVVDDAIVVVENVERNRREKGLSAKEAAIVGIKEVTGPVIAIVFVLCAVFIPVAFLGGIAGQLYKQFAITICISVIISGIVALTLSPALSAIFLEHQKENALSRWFHARFNALTNVYVKGAHWFLNHWGLGLVLFVLLLGAIAFFVKTIPTSFVPAEDQGYFVVVANLPDAASLERTKRVSEDVTKITLQNPAVENLFAFTGFSFLEGGPRFNAATYFPILKDWSERKDKSLHVTGIINALTPQYNDLPQAQILPFNPPPITGLGKVGGLECWVMDKTGQGLGALTTVTNDLVLAASKRRELTGVNMASQPNALQLFVDLDRDKAKAYGVEIKDVFETLNALFGSIYVNDFTKFGRVFQVLVQAEPIYRLKLEDIRQIYVRSAYKKMIPLTSLIDFHFIQGAGYITRFDGFPAIQLNGSASLGHSSGDAMEALEETAASLLPEGMELVWSGASYQEKQSGGASLSVLVGGLLVIFFILAALYNRWTLPLAIVLAVPLGFLGAFISVWLWGITNDVYFQIGLVTLVALGAKNAILIVEFAVHKRKEGASPLEAALLASKLRFRAILMTSLTFIFGVLPLVFTTGAGASSRHSVGVGVMGGMISATLLGIFFVPLFYMLIERIKKR